MPLILPPELRKILPAARWEDVSGESGARVWQSQKFVVKVQPRGRPESLRTEQIKLRWLAGRVPVPFVIAYVTDEASEYLAMTRLPGLPMHHPDALLHGLRNADLLARALRELHALPIQHCPFNENLAVRLQQARERVQLGLIDEANFDGEHTGKSAAQVLSALVQSRPVSEELSVTHGDPCLPNILVSGEYVEGFIDVGRLGLADRHVDLVLALYSLRRNADEAAAEQFLDTYGRERIDPARLAYYELLDTLF